MAILRKAVPQGNNVYIERRVFFLQTNSVLISSIQNKYKKEESVQQKLFNPLFGMNAYFFSFSLETGHRDS